MFWSIIISCIIILTNLLSQLVSITLVLSLASSSAQQQNMRHLHDRNPCVGRQLLLDTTWHDKESHWPQGRPHDHHFIVNVGQRNSMINVILTDCRRKTDVGFSYKTVFCLMSHAMQIRKRASMLHCTAYCQHHVFSHHVSYAFFAAIKEDWRKQ